MNALTELAIEHSKDGIFSRAEVACWAGGSANRQYSLLKRAVAAGEITKLHRGLYCLVARYLPRPPHPFELAQRIYGPSYISMESALSAHRLIPEAVYTVTSTSLNRSCHFSTPRDDFSFTRIPQKEFYLDVTRSNQPSDGCYFLASALKALTDLVYARSYTGHSLALLDSLRIDRSFLSECDPSSIDRLSDNYRSVHVRRFLDSLKKEVQG